MPRVLGTMEQVGAPWQLVTGSGATARASSLTGAVILAFGEALGPALPEVQASSSRRCWSVARQIHFPRTESLPSAVGQKCSRLYR